MKTNRKMAWMTVEERSRAVGMLIDGASLKQAVRSDVDELERVRNDYISKNHEQVNTINLFMSHIAALQTELQSLAQNQFMTQKLMKQKEDSLDNERELTKAIEKKYHQSKMREDDISLRKIHADQKLKEAHNETLEISANLHDAHEWFKTKFDKLQHELKDSRKAQSKLISENEDQRQQLEAERQHAQLTADRAKVMIQNSRQTIAGLANYVEKVDNDFKRDLSKLSAQESSSRQLESLLKSFDSEG